MTHQWKNTNYHENMSEKFNNSRDDLCVIDSGNFVERYNVKTSLQSTVPFFLVLFSIILITGVVGNFNMIYSMCKDQSYKNPTSIFLINISVIGLLQLLIVLPLSLTNMMLS